MTDSDEYDDEMEHVLREVTEGSDLDSHPRLDPRSDQGGDSALSPLCRECVRESPAIGSDLCEFCQVVGS